MENQNEKLGQESAFPTEPKQEVIGNESYTFTNEKGNTEVGYQNIFDKIPQNGMSKRFYAACTAMQGLLVNYKISIGIPNVNQNSMEDSLKREKQVIKDIITKSYELADELLKQENE